MFSLPLALQSPPDSGLRLSSPCFSMQAGAAPFFAWEAALPTSRLSWAPAAMSSTRPPHAQTTCEQRCACLLRVLCSWTADTLSSLCDPVQGVAERDLLKEVSSYDTVGCEPFWLPPVYAVGPHQGDVPEIIFMYLFPWQERILCADHPRDPRWVEVRLRARPPQASRLASLALAVLKHYQDDAHLLPCRQCSIVTSAFHMPRSRAIFETCFALAGATLWDDPAHFRLDFHAAHDEYIFAADVLQARALKEQQAWRCRWSGMPA